MPEKTGTRAGPTVAVTERVDGSRLQRDIMDNWVAETTIKGFLFTKGRPRLLKELDNLIADYLKTRSMKSYFTANIPKLEAILAKIAEWRKANPKGDERKAKIDELETTALKELSEFQEAKDKHERELAVAKPLHAIFHSMEPELAEFAGRSLSDYKVERFKGPLHERLQALTMPREEGSNALTDEAIKLMNRLDIQDLKQRQLDVSASAKLEVDPGVSKEQLEQLMTNNVNPVTGATIYPELRNFTEPNTETDAPVTEPMDIGGVTMSVTYNKSDVNFMQRLNMFVAAVKKVQDAGFTVPAFEVNLPKAGRSLSVNSKCEVTIGVDKTERAIYVAPNFIHISSENLNNPLDTKDSKYTDRYKFSSTAFDPSGVGTMVHELGHALHYLNSPAKYHGLWGSIFKGQHSDGRTYFDIAHEEVSEYATKPREFVAEVFLGMVYGKTYSPIVMEMYRKFGGMMPGS